MSNAKNKETANALVPVAPNFIMPGDIQSLQGTMFQEGFFEEKTFSIGDPSGEPGKIPIYCGELLGDGGEVLVEAPGAKADPTTGEVPKNALPVFLFNPIDPVTLKPFRSRTDSIIASHQVANTCRKYLTLAKAQGGNKRAQILFKWNGMRKTRRGNQMNDLSVMARIVDYQNGEG